VEEGKQISKSYATKKIVAWVVGAFGVPLLIIILVVCFGFLAVAEMANASGEDRKSIASGGVGVTPATLQTFANWAMDKQNWNSTTSGGNPGIDVDGVYGAQCADISKAWVQRVLGLPTPPLLTAQDEQGRAVDWGDSVPAGANKQDSNTKIKAGDVIFFKFGHTAIALNNEDDGGGFRVIEQNLPSPHENSYDKLQVSAFFRLGEIS
jgi:hypothetical protein